MLFNLNLRMGLEKSRSASTANTFGALGGGSGGSNGSRGLKAGFGGKANLMEIGRAAVKVVGETRNLGGIQVHHAAHLSEEDKKGPAPFNDAGVSITSPSLPRYFSSRLPRC